jgi:hypothetical protein
VGLIAGWKRIFGKIERPFAGPLSDTIRPMIERVPLEQAAEAYGKMMRNEARFRMVIDFSL